jgi:hypothetical protein
MGVYVKQGGLGGGSWKGPIAAGLLRVKWGSDWYTPAALYARPTPGIGSNSSGWYDSGYRGYPATPSAPWVHAWDYNNVAIGWNAGGGGAPVAAYQLVQTDSNGNWMNAPEVGGSPWGNFSVGPGGYYQFFVRAKTAAGLYSPFAGPLRIYIGQPSQYYETTETGTRGWSEWHDVAGWGIKDNLVGPRPPGDVIVSQIHWDLGCPYGILSPFNNRSIDIVGNEGQYVWPSVSWQAQEVHGDDYFWHQSNGGRWGFICRGAGWTVSYGGASRVWGSFTVYGSQTYQYQQGHWTAATGNGYW